MKYFKFAYHIFTKNTFMSMILLLQLLISMLLAAVMTGITAGAYRSVAAFGSLAKENGVFYSFDSMKYDPYEDSDGFVLQKIEQADILRVSVYNSESNRKIWAYSSDGLRHFRPPLQKGAWLTDAQPENGVIPGVLTLPVTDADVGDVVQFPIHGSETILVKIVGILKNPFSIDFQKGGTVGADTIMEKSAEPMLLVNQDSMGDEYEPYRFRCSSSLVFYETDDPDVIQANNEALSSFGWVTPFETVRQRALDQAAFVLRRIAPFFVFAFLVTITGLVGCSILLIEDHLRLYGVLFVTGRTWKDCYKIIFAFIAIFSVVGFVVSALLYYLLVAADVVTAMGAIFTPLCVFAPLVIAVVLFAVATVPCALLNRHTPVSLLRKSEA